MALLLFRHSASERRIWTDCRRSLGNSLVLGLLATVVLTFGGLVFLQPILRFLNVPENLLNTATQYVSVIIAGLVITLLYDVLSATLRAIGDTVTPLIVLAVSVVLNIGGDLLLIMVLHMGVLGAAVATVLSQLIAVVVCAVYLWKKYEILRIRVDDLKLPGCRNAPQYVKLRSFHGIHELVGQYRYIDIADIYQ